jgi:3-dehydroquinate synthase
MVMAARLSQAMGWIDEAAVHRISTLIERAHLPVTPPQQMSPQHFMDLMSVDKKVLDGQLRLVLLHAIGKAVVTDQFDPETLSAVLHQN